MLFYILALVFLLITIPFMLYFIKRAFLAIRLKHLCRRKNFRLHKTHFFWFLGKNGEKSYDFHFETENTVFSVKLFGSSFHKYFPAFTEDGKVYFKYFIPFLSMKQPNIVWVDGKKRYDSRFDFCYDNQETSENKESKAFLLIHPNCQGVFRMKKEMKMRLYDGDTVFGAELTSLKRLLQILDTAI